MKALQTAFLSTAIMSFFTVPALAQDNEWSTDIASSFWILRSVTKADTVFGNRKTALRVSDALKQLEIGLLLTGTARRGHWAFTGDLVYLDLEENRKAGLYFAELETKRRFSAFSAYAMYTVLRDPATQVEVGAGLRRIDSDGRLSFKYPNLKPIALANITDNWIDPLVAARVKHRFNQHWQINASMDLGGFGIGNAAARTIQAVATVRYQLNDHWSLVGGYRHLYIDRDNNARDFSLEISGSVLGANYHF